MRCLGQSAHRSHPFPACCSLSVCLVLGNLLDLRFPNCKMGLQHAFFGLSWGISKVVHGRHCARPLRGSQRRLIWLLALGEGRRAHWLAVWH